MKKSGSAPAWISVDQLPGAAITHSPKEWHALGILFPDIRRVHDDQAEWVEIGELLDRKLAPADIPIAQALQSEAGYRDATAGGDG